MPPAATHAESARINLRIRALAAHLDRQEFNCCEMAMNAFFQRQANPFNRRGFGRTYVALADDGMMVVGFLTVSAWQAQAEKLPTHIRVPHGAAPVLSVGRLALDTRVQGLGIGQQLIAFALQQVICDNPLFDQKSQP